jgi:hypothetical protein
MFCNLTYTVMSSLDENDVLFWLCLRDAKRRLWFPHRACAPYIDFIFAFWPCLRDAVASGFPTARAPYIDFIFGLLGITGKLPDIPLPSTTTSLGRRVFVDN